MAPLLLLLAIALNAAPTAAFPTAAAVSSAWTKLADGPYSAREGLMAVVTTQGKIVMTGGRKFFGASAVADAWASDNGTEWKQLPAVPWKARAYHAMIDFKDCIYVMGGQKVAFIGNPFFNDVWKSCDNGVSWESLGNAPWTTRAGIAFTVYKGKMFVAGGCYHSSIGKGRYFLNDVWSSSDGVKWDLMTANASWSARSGARLIVHNDKLMLIAGEIGFTPDTQLGDIWTSGDGKQWDLATASPGFSARSGHGVVVVGQKIYVIAGWVNNLCVHDMWTSTDGIKFEMISNSAWGCSADSCGKFDFWPVLMPNGNIITMGGSNAYATFGKMWKDTWELDLSKSNQTVAVTPIAPTLSQPAATPCCSACSGNTVQYWALDTPNNACAETCLDPSKKLQMGEFWLLTGGKGKLSTGGAPCAAAGFKTYTRTDTLGAGPLKIELDKFSPDK